jgi:hypothetical protein
MWSTGESKIGKRYTSIWRFPPHICILKMYKGYNNSNKSFLNLSNFTNCKIKEILWKKGI